MWNSQEEGDTTKTVKVKEGRCLQGWGRIHVHQSLKSFASFPSLHFYQMSYLKFYPFNGSKRGWNSSVLANFAKSALYWDALQTGLQDNLRKTSCQFGASQRQRLTVLFPLLGGYSIDRKLQMQIIWKIYKPFQMQTVCKGYLMMTSV